MNILKILKDYRLFEILVLGIISGMPLAVIFSTLSFCLTENHVPISIITTFVIARLPYSLKPLWAPIMDHFRVPILGRLGHRKSWIILCVALMSLIFFLISKVSIESSIFTLYILTISLGFVSATLDINVDAFRIERFDESTQAIAVASAILGYRLGMLLTGAGALYFAHITNSWPQTFFVISCILAFSMIFILTLKEQEINREKINVFSTKSLMNMVINPFKDFFSRENSIIILLAIIFFKLGDAMLGVVSGPFYLKLGFTKEDIATGVKLFGVIATLLGTSAGGLVIYRLGNFKGLIITGIAQSLTHIAFIWLNHQGPNFNSLLIAIAIENFACGMGAAALAGYLASLCNKKYPATQYSLLVSSATLCNNTITAYGGRLVEMLDWDLFFILTIIMALPGLALIIYLDRKVQKRL